MSFKTTHLPVANLLQSKGNLLDMSTPIVMGIINITEDSFYANSRMQYENQILAQAEKMIAEGAAILDIGAASSRPGSQIIDAEREAKNAATAIAAIHHNFPSVWISIDTYRSSVAKEGIKAGASIINDISGGKFDTDIMKIAGEFSIPFIAMHLKGSAETMHQQNKYNNLLLDIIEDFQLIKYRSQQAGIKDLILDPGFGFSKSIEENFELLNNMAQLRMLGRPILAGISRKSMIYKSLNSTADLALNGTTALNMVALQQGANILRVHDVKEAIECIKLFEKM